TNTPGPAIPAGALPGGIVITPDGKTAYVANAYGTVTPISTATKTPGPAIPACAAATAIAITPEQSSPPDKDRLRRAFAQRARQHQRSGRQKQPVGFQNYVPCSDLQRWTPSSGVLVSS